jgi:hypothetical protein
MLRGFVLAWVKARELLQCCNVARGVFAGFGFLLWVSRCFLCLLGLGGCFLRSFRFFCFDVLVYFLYAHLMLFNDISLITYIYIYKTV